MDKDNFYEFESRAYIDPKLSSGEQQKFISNFRDIQGQNNAQIATDTYNLGKALPSNLGGLGGGESYFNARYQTPQVNNMVANLESAAKLQELNDAMTNYQSQLKERYNQAYRRYQQRARKSSSGGNGNGSGTGLNITTNNANTSKSGGLWNKVFSDYFSKGLNALNDQGIAYNINNSGMKSIGENLYQDQATGVVYNTNIPAGLMSTISGGGADLGVWPNGTKMTEGSTYNWGGKMYTVRRGLSGNGYDIVEIVNQGNGGNGW